MRWLRLFMLFMACLGMHASYARPLTEPEPWFGLVVFLLYGGAFVWTEGDRGPL